MLYRIKCDYEYKEFTDAKEANDYIQNYLATEDYSICGVTKISDDVIELYFDVV